MNGPVNLANIVPQVTAPGVNPPIQANRSGRGLPKKKEEEEESKSTSNKLHLNFTEPIYAPNKSTHALPLKRDAPLTFSYKTYLEEKKRERNSPFKTNHIYRSRFD